MDKEMGFELSLQDIFGILIKHLIWIVLSIFFFATVAMSYSMFIVTPMYTASMTLYVDPGHGSADSIATEISSFNYAKQRVDTYIELLKTNAFYERISDSIGGKYSVKALAKMISVTPVADTELFNVTVTASNPEESMLISEMIAKYAPETITDIMGVDSISIADPPVMPINPSNNRTVQNTVIGALIGGILSAGCAILFDTFDTRIKCSEELRIRYKIPILGEIINFDET